MFPKKNNPKLKIKRTAIDWVLELIAIMFLIILIVLPFVFYKKLPESIPVHFNGAGQADGFGSKSSIWILPFAGAIMWQQGIQQD